MELEEKAMKKVMKEENLNFNKKMMERQREINEEKRMEREDKQSRKMQEVWHKDDREKALAAHIAKCEKRERKRMKKEDDNILDI